MADAVIKPEHYQAGGIETIDVIRAKLGPVGFGYYCEGNVLKYLTRWRHKGGVEDLRKAGVYLDWLLTEAQLSVPRYKEQAAQHHAVEAPMPPIADVMLGQAFDGDEEPGALKAGEAFRDHADGAA